MRTHLAIGSERSYIHLVTKADTASFPEAEGQGGGLIHPLYATFALGRDAEWACRLFVLEVKEADEEGIGTALSVYHEAPTPVGASVVFTAKLTELHGNTVVCSWEAHWNSKRIAHGTQTQRVLKITRLEAMLEGLSA